jgi:hypothetical protein
MRPAVLAACLALALLAWPVAAEVVPTQPTTAFEASNDARVVMDAVFWVTPGPAAETCLQLPPSRVAIAISVEPVGPPSAVRYHFVPYSYRAADSPLGIEISVTRQPQTVEATLAGGRYCYAIVNEATPPPDADLVDSVGPAQLVAVRMLLTQQ